MAVNNRNLAAIEYHGSPGNTSECLEALEGLLLYRGDFASVRILTLAGEPVAQHALLLTTAVGDLVGVKSGFTSGYSGQGPRGFSTALSLIHWHRIEMEEVEVSEEVIERLDYSALTRRDMERVTALRPLRPQRLWEYISEQDYLAAVRGNPWRYSRKVIPLSILDERIAEFARDFWDDPDGALIKIHRRLETIVRVRIGDEPDSGDLPSRVFARAFSGDAPKLTWADTSKGERQGRANLFSGTQMAYRNARAHREEVKSEEDQLAELLLLNLLFKLESQAVPR